MNIPGRNEPCHCGSGKKYKKCCLRKDEETRQREKEEEFFARGARSGGIDPLAGDEDWEEEPAAAREEESEEDGRDGDGGKESDDSAQDLTTRDETEPGTEKEKLSAEDEATIEAWWTAYQDLSDPDAVRGHLENFMSSRPDLVSELGLEPDTLFELRRVYIRQDRHAEYIDFLSRFRSGFPEVYAKGAGYFDCDMIAWLAVTGRKAEIPGYLDGFRADPANDPDNLFAVIHFLMSWNCQDILADFVPGICREVCTSSLIVGGGEILIPMSTIVMAPCLDRGLDGCNPEQLAEEMKKIGDILNPLWTDRDFLKARLGVILGRHEAWGLDGCTTRRQAMQRYDEMTGNFMGWLHAGKGLDWCAAEHHRQLVLDYLGEALPEKKKPIAPFPFAGQDMDRLLVRLCKKTLWLDSTRLFGLLNGIYWFLEFLEDTRSLDAEQARQGRETCVRFFARVYPGQRQQDFMALAWDRFPRAR